MKKERFLLDYLYSRRYFIVLLLLFIFLIDSMFFLYQMPKSAINYMAVFSFSLVFILWLLDFMQMKKKRLWIRRLMQKEYLKTEDFWETKDRLDLDFRELILLQNQRLMEHQAKTEKNRTEMIDYYTLWAHQIKTPVAALGLLIQTEESEKKAELGRELFKIEQYIDMVLQFLRLEDSSNDLVIREINLYQIVRRGVLKYANLFFYEKITLNLEEFHCVILSDEKWIGFVVEQILSNALKYTKKGQVSIYLDPKEKKTLVIEDTGIGIQAEDIPRVFDKGYTGFNGRMEKKSTGIGLYLVKKVMTKLSHKITIESQVGMGTKVLLDLNMEKLDMIE